MQNKTIVITGSSSGIGKACVEHFLSLGAKVIMIDQNDPAKEPAHIRSKGEKSFYRCDLSDEKEVEKVFRRIRQENDQLDYAFNNAGIEGADLQTHQYSYEEWDRALKVNLYGVWLCMKYELEFMLKNTGQSSIVNCSSVAGLKGMANLAPYVASKHALIGLTKSAALEYAANKIRINAICPGAIETPMIERYTQGDAHMKQQLQQQEPIGRLGSPMEIADALEWLCSEKSSFVTGHALCVDGGWCAH